MAAEHVKQVSSVGRVPKINKDMITVAFSISTSGYLLKEI